MQPDALRAALASGLVLSYGATSQRIIPQAAQLPANLGAAAFLVLLARRWGRSWAELGLDVRDLGRGIGAGVATVPPIAAAVSVMAAIPSLRGFLHDDRVVDASPGEVARHVLVRVPLATALAEELLFRGALLALSNADAEPTRAIAATSLVFGVWHVLPALRSHRSNPGAARLAQPLGGAGAVVAVTVAATTIAGASLAWLRLRSRSVLAPAIAHAALNGLALLAARSVTRAHRAASAC